MPSKWWFSLLGHPRPPRVRSATRSTTVTPAATTKIPVKKRICTRSLQFLELFFLHPPHTTCVASPRWSLFFCLEAGAVENTSGVMSTAESAAFAKILFEMMKILVPFKLNSILIELSLSFNFEVIIIARNNSVPIQTFYLSKPVHFFWVPLYY